MVLLSPTQWDIETKGKSFTNTLKQRCFLHQLTWDIHAKVRPSPAHWDRYNGTSLTNTLGLWTKVSPSPTHWEWLQRYVRYKHTRTLRQMTVPDQHTGTLRQRYVSYQHTGAWDRGTSAHLDNGTAFIDALWYSVSQFTNTLRHWHSHVTHKHIVVLEQ